MARKRYDEELNRILHHPDYDPGDFLIIYEHRGGPPGLESLSVSEISRATRKTIVLHSDIQLPLHRIVQIRNRRTGEMVAGEKLELDKEAWRDLLGESQGQEIEAHRTENAKLSGPSPPQPQGITVAVRAAYPERGEYSWTEALLPFTDVGAVEVAFLDPHLFQRVQIRDVVEPFSKLRTIKASSVHMPHVRLTEPDVFARTLDKTVRIAKALGCPLIVVHPSRGQPPEVEGFFAQRVDPLLEKAGVLLCWEVFQSKRRFLTGIEGIATFCQRRPWHYACYDTSHVLQKSQEAILKDIKTYAPIIKCFHLSNRSGPRHQHLPLRHPEGELNFREILDVIRDSDFSGSITLEYMKEYHDRLLQGALWVRGQLGTC